MLQRMLIWGLSRYFGGAGRSWLFIAGSTLALRGVRRIRGRKPRVEVLKLGKDHQVAVDHLTVSHKRQIAEAKAERRRSRRAARRATA